MKLRFRIPELNTEQEEVVQEIVNRHDLMHEVALVAAKACDYDLVEVSRYLCKTNKPYSYKGLNDVEKAATLLAEHINKKSKIRIIGDYDVDGVTSVSVLYLTLSELKCNVSYYLPNRKLDGYGINEKIVSKCIEDGIELLITVDNGTTAYGAIDLAKQADIDVIVTDHHEVTGPLPNADAVINPHRPDNTYSFQGLAGVGVAYKLVQALFVEMGLRPPTELIQKLYALVAMGTVCDVMELKRENRDLVIKGLQALKGGAFPHLVEFTK